MAHRLSGSAIARAKPFCRQGFLPAGKKVSLRVPFAPFADPSSFLLLSSRTQDLQPYFPTTVLQIYFKSFKHFAFDAIWVDSRSPGPNLVWTRYAELTLILAISFSVILSYLSVFAPLRETTLPISQKDSSRQAAKPPSGGPIYHLLACV